MQKKSHRNCLWQLPIKQIITEQFVTSLWITSKRIVSQNESTTKQIRFIMYLFRKQITYNMDHRKHDFEPFLKKIVTERIYF
jgi:hypothetical protein